MKDVTTHLIDKNNLIGYSEYIPQKPKTKGFDFDHHSKTSVKNITKILNPLPSVAVWIDPLNAT
jgi:hypothetical protein